jgi:glycosyltransferase involved in cell wall biosynthesis
MAERPLRILQIGTVESGGGAASVALNLARGCRSRGCEAWLAVGRKTSDDPAVFRIPDDRRTVYRLSGYAGIERRLEHMASRRPGRGWGRIARTLRFATHPRAWAAWYAGREDFEFPGTFDVLDLAPARPDLVHCHNLHGGYFDLRALPWLSRQVPTVLTLHDAWTLTGHCAHSFDCDRWRTGCGTCPDLAIEPAIRRDATAANWARKRGIYAASRLYVAAPSAWLLGRVEQSMLAPAVADAVVIPNGVDLSVFHPADKRAARSALNIPPDALVLLAAAGPRGQAWRDDKTLRAALDSIAERMRGHPLTLVALGGPAGAFRDLRIDVREVQYQIDPAVVARHLQAADVYVHSARAATFPTAIIEALACGTPVVAASVGGIPEQIVSVGTAALRSGIPERVDGSTSVLVPAGVPDAMADAVVALLECGELRQRLGDQAARDARRRFDVNRQVERYLAWYRTIIGDWTADETLESCGTVAGALGRRRTALD